MIAGLAVITGFLLDITIAARYGAGPITDSFFVAARVPLGVSALAVAAANQALVPAFSNSILTRGERDTWRLVSIIITAAVGSGALVVGAVSLVAGPLVAITAPGLPTSEAHLAAQLMPITFAMVPLVVASEVLRALLNARFSFVVPAATNIALSATAATLIYLIPRDAHVIAWAYLAGAVIQLAFISSFAMRNGFRYRPSLRVRDAHFQSVARLSVRPIVAGGLNPLARIAEQVLLSFLPTGSITIIAYGYRLISAVGGTIFFRSVMVTLLPRMSAARERPEELRRLTGQGLKIMLAVSLPLTAFIAVLGSPGAVAVFQRGRFTRAEALVLGIVISVYAFSLVGSAVQRALLAPFFAALDTRTPLRNTIYGVVANLLLLPAAAGAMALAGGRPVIGIAIAYSLAQYVNVAHAAYRLRSIVDRPWQGVAPVALKLVVASSAAAAAMLPVEAWLGLGGPQPRWFEVAGVLGTGAVGAAVLAIALALFFTSELRRTLHRTDLPLRRAARNEITAPAAEAANGEGV